MKLLNLIANQARRRSSVIAACFLGFLLAVLSFVALTVHQTAGIYTSWPYFVSFIVVGAGISALMCLRYRLKIAVCTGIGFLLSILFLLHYDARPAKAFRRLDAAIQSGMTLAEVRLTVQRACSRPGQFPVRILPAPSFQTGEEVLFIGSRFDFNMAVFFHNGRVIDKFSNPTPGSDIGLPTALAMVGVIVGLFGWACPRSSAVNRWVGHGPDVTSLAERLQRVRRDYLGAYRTRHHVACHRRDLLASAGLAVRRFHYFRGRAVESSEDSEDEQGNA